MTTMSSLYYYRKGKRHLDDISCNQNTFNDFGIDRHVLDEIKNCFPLCFSDHIALCEDPSIGHNVETSSIFYHSDFT